MISKFTNEILNKIICEFKKTENQELIKTNVIDPTIYYILDKLYPYIFFTSTIFILLLLIAIVILTLVIKSSFTKSNLN